MSSEICVDCVRFPFEATYEAVLYLLLRGVFSHPPSVDAKSLINAGLRDEEEP